VRHPIFVPYSTLFRSQNWLPQVHAPRKLKDFFSDAGNFDLRLIGSLQPDAIHFTKILGDYTDQHRDRPKSVLMLVGPEGDFTPRSEEHTSELQSPDHL